ncbi:hypothetical protein [Flavobacterium granuli]|uniref:Uncharacterized protein n=1 Tax=Flavobacterium granuli TaxID=280093 RepID=A0A1M5NUU5_9FLAO|nr:hypothetical protein [Flavobacterium granuli]PRZ23407.1 hypothetical protein BC624_105129 [Flavobacterium granuli]SHG93356.1 hypothetical protein SAMN05443373_105129 [Flavobacterium granuli]
MEKNQTLTSKSNKRLVGIMLSATIMLLIPLIAMQFTNEVKWTSLDFIAAAILLFGAGLTLELILRKGKTTKYRIAACIALFIVLFLIWAELAVGIFGTAFAGH